MPTPFSVEQNCLCNSGRGHHEEHFCEIIQNLDHWLRRRCHLKTFLIMSSGNPCFKVSMGAKIRNRYNQVPHLTQDTNGKVTNSQPDTTNESQEVSPSQHVTTRHTLSDVHKGIANERQKKHKRSTKEVPPWDGQ